MTIVTSYPGVYIDEVPSGVRTLVGVATSITAFIGRALRGPVDDPIRIQSFADFERRFGGLWVDSMLSYAVQHYFLNGGTDAIIVRVHNGASTATADLPAGASTLTLNAASPGAWGSQLRVLIDHNVRPLLPGEAPDSLFNLAVKDRGTGVTERFLNVSIEADHPRNVKSVLEQESTLVRIPGAVPGDLPDEHDPTLPGTDPFDDANDHTDFSAGATDGNPIGNDQIVFTGFSDQKRGLYALEKTDLFNILCIPPYLREGGDVGSAIWSTAATYVHKRRAMLIVDPPGAWTGVDVVLANTGLAQLGADNENAAVYFPRIRVPDPLKENRLETFAPCGAVAGIMARTDGQRGVWKAPAGIEATVVGAVDVSVKLTDGENGRLNPLGVNCLRSFPVVGRVVWGARTRKGADMLASEWKYLPVRRLALFLEESLYRGTQWVVFEPNDEPLWSQIRMNVGAFMQNLFRQGAFQGASPREAYFVKCDKESTTQNDINLGIVNIVVGFAPLKPAEFVIIKIQQIAGNVEA